MRLILILSLLVVSGCKNDYSYNQQRARITCPEGEYFVDGVFRIRVSKNHIEVIRSGGFLSYEVVAVANSNCVVVLEKKQ